MIEKHYAVHLKNTLDAAAINVRKNSPPRKEDAPDRASPKRIKAYRPTQRDPNDDE